VKVKTKVEIITFVSLCVGTILFIATTSFLTFLGLVLIAAGIRILPGIKYIDE